MRSAVTALGNGPHQRQPQAHTAVAFARSRHAVEGFKNAIARVLRYAWASVSHAHFRIGALLAQKQGNRPLRVAARVLQQVANGAAHQLGNAAHFQLIAVQLAHIQLGLDARAFFGAQTNQVDQLGRAHVGFARIQAAGQQNLVHQLVQLGDIALDFLLEGGRGLVAHQLHPHADAGERRAQLVRRIGQQRFVRLHQGLDARGRSVELVGQLAYLVVAAHIHAHRQVAITKLFNALAQAL